MITLSSCLIWKIISFILPPNKYGCVNAWTTLWNIATLLWKSWKWKKRSSIRFVCSLYCKKSGILIDKPKHGKPKTVPTPENIAAVAKSVCEAPSTSIHRRFEQLNISETSLRQILHKDLDITPRSRSWSQLTIQCIFASLSGSAIDLQKMPILPKNSAFQIIWFPNKWQIMLLKYGPY